MTDQSWAELRGYRERNTSPVLGIEKYKEQKRTQSMQKEELEPLGSAFVTMEAANSIDPIIAAADTAAALLTDFTGGKVLPFKKVRAKPCIR